MLSETKYRNRALAIWKEERERKESPAAASPRADSAADPGRRFRGRLRSFVISLLKIRKSAHGPLNSNLAR
ncbi:hypothetical protein [Cohnella caldifontis]|uniref:hypothetical protein n=1 Tax=Cohnella caldifontis TaxID=3027471 RepID=UPI0023ED5DCA|nr:hypothetical protein [Cohnella sp. YIM B05605]